MTDLHPRAIYPTEGDGRILDRTMWRIMPLAAILMAICTIDRSNIGFAKLAMANSLRMSETTFALGSSLFYVGYLLFEIPSALAGHRYGARVWFARIMATWGVATLLLAFAHSATLFYVLRFGLGIAEAGLYPGLIYYITLWFPKHQHPRALGFLTVGSALGNGAGALISGPLLDMHGMGGLEGWQWIFIVTGALPLLMLAVVLIAMRDRPEQARFLSAADRERLVELVRQDSDGPRDERRILAAIADLRVLGHGLVYATILTALYGMIYWSPSLIHTLGVSGTTNGLLVALPWAIDVVLLLTLPRRLTTATQVLGVLVLLAALGALSCAASMLLDAPLARYGALLVGIPCISLVLGLYWTFPVRMFRGAQSAAAVAAVSMLGNFGGLIGQNAMPAAAKAGGSALAALWVPMVCLALIAIGSAAAFLRRGTHAS